MRMGPRFRHLARQALVTEHASSAVNRWMISSAQRVLPTHSLLLLLPRSTSHSLPSFCMSSPSLPPLSGSASQSSSSLLASSSAVLCPGQLFTPGGLRLSVTITNPTFTVVPSSATPGPETGQPLTTVVSSALLPGSAGSPSVDPGVTPAPSPTRSLARPSSSVGQVFVGASGSTFLSEITTVAILPSSPGSAFGLLPSFLTSQISSATPTLGLSLINLLPTLVSSATRGLPSTGSDLGADTAFSTTVPTTASSEATQTPPLVESQPNSGPPHRDITAIAAVGGALLCLVLILVSALVLLIFRRRRHHRRHVSRLDRESSALETRQTASPASSFFPAMRRHTDPALDVPSNLGLAVFPATLEEMLDMLDEAEQGPGRRMR
ncbi:unnamed protein product [Mycena citricolor]|uniref:Uncharacterized protein n=1 Tax=Mycena citricolor TaxID=2018698 RepID=A0AAD2GZ27_9AGAR|nr:unnamed protein product [Mycena citricolor]CAK5280427.1 unnamed protein product [Mycena citricolor]